MVNDSKYNEDELHAPEWLNDEFFERALKNVEHKDVKIADCLITPGTNKSDHYASVMFRAKLQYGVDGVDKQRSFIIKCAPYQEGLKKEIMDQVDVFDTEIKMYTQTIPKMEAILREHGDNTKLCAELVYFQLGAHKCIVFEDLTERGFTTIGERNCSMEEGKAAYLRLAKIHAVSYKLAKEDDTSITSYNKGTFNSISLDSSEFIMNSIKSFKELIAPHADLRSYLPHIEHVEADLLEKCVASFDAYGKGGVREGIFVLNHGDFHMKNMMVKYVNGDFKDFLLVDYQMCIYASPALDLMYSVAMLMSPEMRSKHRDELFYYYFTNFRETLKKMEFTGHIPTIEEFQQELRKHKHWELYLFMSFLVLNYIFRDGEGDLGKMVEDEKYRKEALMNPDLLEEIRLFLPRYLYGGYFE